MPFVILNIYSWKNDWNMPPKSMASLYVIDRTNESENYDAEYE